MRCNPDRTPAIEMNTNTTLQPISADTLKSLEQTFTNACKLFSESQTGNFTAAIQVARAIGDMRRAMDTPEVKACILELQDCSLGFRTDRDPNRKKDGRPNIPYDWPVVRDAALEAALRGLMWAGNQFNIISERFYATKEGFHFLLKKQADSGKLSDLKLSFGVPKTLNGGAIVACTATWNLGGVPDKLEAEIPVKTDSYSGTDQILGKAERKFCKRIYERITGQNVPDGDPDGDDSIPVESTVSPAPQLAAPTAPMPEMPRQRRTRTPAQAVNEAVTQPATTAAPTTPVEPPKAAPVTPPAPTTPELPVQSTVVAARTGPNNELTGKLPPKDLAPMSPQDRYAAFIVDELGSNFDAFTAAVRRLEWEFEEDGKQTDQPLLWTSFSDISDYAIKIMEIRSFKNAMRNALKSGGAN